MSLPVELRPAFAAALRAETDPDLVAAIAGGNHTFIAAWCNEPSTFIAWRTSITRDEILGDGFDFTQVDNLTVGQARIFDWLLWDGNFDPSQASKRAGVSECWKGTASKVAVGTYILGLCKHAVTRAQKMFATGTGTTQTPGQMVFEGLIDTTDVGRSLNEF